MPVSLLLSLATSFGKKYWRQGLLGLALALITWFYVDCRHTKRQLADMQLRAKIAGRQVQVLETQQQWLEIKLALKDSEIVKAQTSYDKAKQTAATHVIYVPAPRDTTRAVTPADTTPQYVAVSIESLPEVQALEKSCDSLTAQLKGKIVLLEQDTLSKSLEIATIKSVAVIEITPHPGVMERLGNAGSHAAVGAAGAAIGGVVAGPLGIVVGAAVGAVIGVFHHG